MTSWHDKERENGEGECETKREIGWRRKKKRDEGVLVVGGGAGSAAGRWVKRRTRMRIGGGRRKE